jgi:hypothetical protein
VSKAPSALSSVTMTEIRPAGYSVTRVSHATEDGGGGRGHSVHVSTPEAPAVKAARPRRQGIIRGGLVAVPAAAALAVGLLASAPAAHGAQAPARSAATVAAGPQYDTAHVYVAPGDVAAFVSSWKATFGGTSTTPKVTDVTPTPSETISELVLSPVGTLSVFGFTTPVPYPFGQERGGDLVTSFSAGVADATRSGALLMVSPWNDPIGKDAIVAFPGGVNEQIYWHTTAPSYPPLATIPQSRVYLTPGAAAAFIRDYLAFTRGHITLDDSHADGGQIGLPGTKFREVAISSAFGKTLVIITDGHLPYPFGLETTGYAVTSLTATLARARSAGAKVVWGPYHSATADTAMVKFPGGYIAEVHQAGSPS